MPPSEPGPTGGSAGRALAGRRILSGVLAVVVGLGLAFALLEGGLRLYSRITPNADVEFVRYAQLMKKAAPGSATSFRHAPRAHARLMGVDVAIDGRGYRDVPQSAAVRVALIGDSITFGWGVPYGKRFSEILENDWSKDLGRSVDLINTGHGNYNSAQERALLVENFADERIDGVIQVWYVNDAEPTPPHRDLPWYGRFQTAVFFWAKTDLLRRRAGERATYVDYYRGLYRPGAAGLAGFDDALRGVGEWTRAHGVPWVFVVLPEFHGFGRGGPFDAIYREVSRKAQDEGAIVVDATAAFLDVDPASIRVAYNDVHPNAKGHAIIADAIRHAIDPRIFLRHVLPSGAGEERRP
ncbi:MAG: SGNH/GDSL hydrolase family protein [bacterium]